MVGKPGQPQRILTLCATGDDVDVAAATTTSPTRRWKAHAIV
jgi:hypothetical protein